MAKQILTNLDFNNVSKITNLPAPVDGLDAVNKDYVDSAIEGLAWKDSCRVATQSNINLTIPGATIDGVTMASGNRVLIRSQTIAYENGIYIWNGAATPMTRAIDANTSDELEQATVTVEEGTSASASYRQTSVNFTLDFDDIVWALFGTSVGAASETSAGIAEIATQAEVDAGTDDARIVTPLKLKEWSGRIAKYATHVGNGSSTTYTITHNLDTLDVMVEVYRNSGDQDTILCDVGRVDTNSVQLTFSSAPSSNAFRVVVLG